MNALHEPSIPLIGAAMAGGFFAGCIRHDEAWFGLIVAPSASGERKPTAWSKAPKAVVGAASYNDGMANTVTMAAAGSALAKWARGLSIGSHDDWYLPARDELELVYRHLKPGSRDNWVYRNGDNPSSLPLGYPYTATLPGQTAVELFRVGGPEALVEEWYWTSTQFAGVEQYAWCQHFDDGYQTLDPKLNKLRARAVRRFPL